MKINNKLKRNIALLVCVLTVFLSVMTPLSSVVINANNDDESAISTGLNEYAGDAESAGDLLGKFVDDDPTKAANDRNKFSYVLYRVFTPQYINDVRDGVLAKELDDPRTNGKVCNPNEPQNLLNHNCDVPNFAAEFAQTFMNTFGASGIQGGDKTASRPAFDLGVPAGIPGGTVPINESERASRYTALELYGYSLNFTTYEGEWDKINTSTQSRMLSNFGLMDKLKLTGTSIWNGLSSGLGALIEGFSFNPIKWAGNVFSATAGGAFNAIVDTSELNVIATHGWKRDTFNSTLYNVYTLSDKEVIIESGVRYMKHFTDKLSELANQSPELQEVMALQAVPEFEYDPMKETEASKKAREDAIAQNEKIDEAGKGKKVKVPEPIYMTEAEQLEDWRKDNADLLARAKAQGLINDDSDTYDKIVKEWGEKWTAYSKREFAANGIVVADLQKEAEKDYFLKDPYGDPKRQISHYVCATPDGKPMRSSDGSYEYLYTDENTPTGENLNSKCKAPRPTIKGGYFGTGDNVNNDTRRQFFDNKPSSGIPIIGNISAAFASFIFSITKFFTKVTNVVLGLAFTPILESLGITKMVSGMMIAFRDTIFFPLAVLFIAFGTIMTFAKMLTQGSAKQIALNIFLSILIFTFGGMLLLRPDLIMDTVEKVPDRMDNAIANLILTETNPQSICATSGNGIKDGIRSAQCNVWESNIFHPWVQGQFGTNYSQLYAKGYAGEGSSFNNKNEDLVGDAGVYMGGGYTEHNWAMYQLDKMKTGTITTDDLRNAPGMTDPNLYRLVDLQAGPNNGELSDSHLLSDWASGDGRIGVALLSLIQSSLVFLVIGGLAFLKIQYTFLFALGIIFLPIMLLKAMTPKGQQGLKGYGANLFGLYLKRVFVVIMLSVVLRVLNQMAIQNTFNYTTSVIAMCALLLVFKSYQKELLEVMGIEGGGNSLTSGDPKALSEAIKRTTPLYVRNKAQVTKARVKGSVAGAVGGGWAGLSFNRQHKNDEFLIDDNRNNFQNMLDGVTRGITSGSAYVGNVEERKVRKSGFSGLEVVSKSKQRVVEDGAKKISSNDETLAGDTYKELMSHTERGNKYRTTKDDLTSSDANMLLDPKTQRIIREEAQRRRDELKKTTQDMDITVKGTDKAAEKLDKRRPVVAAKDILSNPAAGIRRAKSSLSEVDKSDPIKHKTQDIKETLADKETELKREAARQAKNNSDDIDN